MNNEKNKNRKKYFLTFFSIITIIVIMSVINYFFYSSKSIETDNSYTQADSAQIISRISAPVKSINVIDTQYVIKGDPLVILDDIDAKIDFQIAKANLESEKRKVKQLLGKDIQFNEMIQFNDSQIASAKAHLKKTITIVKKAKKDLNRYSKLLNTKSISKQSYDNIKLIYDSANADLETTKADLETAKNSKLVTQAQKNSNFELIQDERIDNNPAIIQAERKFNQAKINLARTIIKAPISGVVTQRNVKLGQYINTNTRLLNIIPIDKIYVNANFKESKLKEVKTGQKVELFSDLYGNDILYHGIVEGISGATGSALALIPAQNATGNWIKVVQRLPIRIKISKKDLKKNPLNIGLSMHTKIYLDQMYK